MHHTEMSEGQIQKALSHLWDMKKHSKGTSGQKQTENRATELSLPWYQRWGGREEPRDKVEEVDTLVECGIGELYT